MVLGGQEFKKKFECLDERDEPTVAQQEFLKCVIKLCRMFFNFPKTFNT